jgi:hypothetical protein
MMNAEAPRRGRGRSKSQFAAAAAEAAAEQAPQSPAEPAKDDLRRDLRPAMREEDPRTRAARRAAEIRDHLGGSVDEGTDEFYIPMESVPDGWTYEWKRKSVLGQEDAAHQIALARKGWEPVPASRHPSFMPEGGHHATIERKGMILMERPVEITSEARAAELRRARLQVRHKEEQLNAAPQGQFERNNKDSSLVKIGKSYEAVPVPKD